MMGMVIEFSQRLRQGAGLRLPTGTGSGRPHAALGQVELGLPIVWRKKVNVTLPFT